MENEKIEISTICAELEKLAHSGVFAQNTVDACTQGSSLLKKMREVILTGRVDSAVVEKLKWILVEQGEG